MTPQQQLESAIAYHRAGKFAEAENLYRQVLVSEPRNADALRLLGTVMWQGGDVSSAIELTRQAITARPHDPQAYRNLGALAAGQSRLNEAIAAYQKVIELLPKDAQAHSDLGRLFAQAGQFEKAIAELTAAISLDPSLSESHRRLGGAFYLQRQFQSAIEPYRRAIALNANFAQAYAELGAALRATGQLEESLGACRKAVELKPDLVFAYLTMGGVCADMSKYDQAVDAYRKAIAIDPSSFEGNNNLGRALIPLSELDGAIESFRRAMALMPSNVVPHSNLIFTMSYYPADDAQAILAEQRRWDEKYGQPLKTRIRPHENARDPDRRLRIGYIAPDLHDHPAGRNILPLFRQHDRSQTEVFCYSFVARPDAITEQCRECVDHWRDALAVTYEQTAEQIRRDQIDILVDLALHTGSGQLIILAYKPAPVQLTFAGYPGGTGLSTIDWRLTDPHLDPPGVTDADYVERSYRLPDSFWCYDPEAMACPDGPQDGGPLPALANGYITFGSLNNFSKVNADVVKLWAQVLKTVDRSRLIVLCPEGSAQQRVLKQLRGEGIPSDRIRLVAPQFRAPYFELYRQIDIGLDTFPYNGHTTSLDALWMGVPVVTLVGKTVVGRAGVSQLTNLGMPELVARTPEDYVRIAATLAADLPHLADLRAGIRRRMLDSPLCDAKRFARNIESAYRQIWRQWCASGS